jgi:MYXO-CTERM domain-containing protein
MRTTLFVSSLLVSALALTPRALACSCFKLVAPEGVSDPTAAIFEGTVVGIELASQYERRVSFVVHQSWQGVEGPHTQVMTGLGGGDCGYEFVEDETYVVFADVGSDGSLGVNICGGTQVTSATQLERLGAPIWVEDEGELLDVAADGEDAELATQEEGAVAVDLDAIEGNAAAPHAPKPPKPPSTGDAKKGGGCSVVASPSHEGALALVLALGAALSVRRRRLPR